MRKNNFVSLKKVCEAMFHSGLSLVFSLGTLGDRIAPKLKGQTEKQIKKRLKKEFDRI